MKNVLVLGAGKIGVTISALLGEHPEEYRVTIADTNPGALEFIRGSHAWNAWYQPCHSVLRTASAGQRHISEAGKVSNTQSTVLGCRNQPIGFGHFWGSRLLSKFSNYRDSEQFPRVETWPKAVAQKRCL